MNKKYQEFINFRRRGMMVVYLFCIAFFLLLIPLVILTLQHNPIKKVNFILIIFSTICLLLSFIQMFRNYLYVNKLETTLLNNYDNSDAKKYQLFNQLLDENLFLYHFQPIVNAKTGEVFAYEALMRTDDKINMSPVEILDFAVRENRLYDIEKLTLFNALKIMKDYQETFGSKKLFINSISNHLLKDEDFDVLYKQYGTLFKNVVLEITESALIDDDGIKAIRKRLQNANFQLALDDYGAGYSNESLLLNTTPNFIKIDQLILRNINLDTKKQHLVSNIVSFARNNHVKTIAEGIETYEEFIYVIKLGVDYIQGFYTGRPNPMLLQTIPDECLETVSALSKDEVHGSMLSKTYETRSDTTVLSLEAFALDQYSDLLIQNKDIILQGNPDIVTNIKIHIADNLKCCITLDKVRLKANDPVIALGHNCSVILKLVGDNILYQDGIRVPESSELIITGDGNLNIQTSRKLGVGIGGSSEQSYGNITLAGTGSIKINNSSDLSIGIGGAQNTGNSLIHLSSGNIEVEVGGYHAVGIGSISGNAIIKIGKCKLKITSVATKAVAIGCLMGPVNIATSGMLDIRCEGRNTVSIGTLENGVGCVTVQDGSISISYNAHSGAGIGGIDGSINIILQNGDIDIYAEGSDIVGIGDYTGTGTIQIFHGIITAVLKASQPVTIGNSDKLVVIDGGNILCDIPEDISVVNSLGIPLNAKLITDTDYFHRTIDTKNGSYDYRAERNDRCKIIRVYLPENY